MLATPNRSYEGGNRLLDALSLPIRTRLNDHLVLRDFRSGEISQEPDGPHEFIDFPVDAILSIVTRMLDGNLCEVGTIGNEGAAGVDVAFGATLLRTVVCQVDGIVARLPRLVFLRTVETSSEFAGLVWRVSQAQRFFVEQQCACNAVHSVVERCARWFLMIYQRVGRDEFAVTHDFLSVMLGVRRATVTLAARRLQADGLIRYKRGVVHVLNVPKLAAICCECHQLTKNVFDSALKPPRPISEARIVAGS